MNDELRKEIRAQLVLAYQRAAMTLENSMRDAGAAPVYCAGGFGLDDRDGGGDDRGHGSGAR